MATAIKATPMLFGNDAIWFEERMQTKRSTSENVKTRMREAYDTFKKIYQA